MEGAKPLSQMGGGNGIILSGSEELGSLCNFLLLKCFHGQEFLLQHFWVLDCSAVMSKE